MKDNQIKTVELKMTTEINSLQNELNSRVEMMEDINLRKK